MMLDTLTKLNSRSLLGAIIRAPLKLIPSSYVVTVRRGINKGRRWIVGSSIHGCWLGTYELEKQAFISQVILPGMTVWDVGANAGFYTLAFSRQVGGSGKVYAFEPFAENTQNLLSHLHMNKIGNAQIVQAALSDKTGVIGFFVAESNSMGCISEEESIYQVPTLTADDFLARDPGSRPDILKIDIEGAELYMLQGASHLLSAFGPDIILALDGESQRGQCIELLRSHGYSLFYLDGQPLGPGSLQSHEIYASKKGVIHQ